MSSPESILDASAFLAFLQGEDGADRVRDALSRRCSMSTVNWAEVLSKIAELGKAPDELVGELETNELLGTALHVVPFEAEDAVVVGDMRPATRHLGLSLGDRACLALGIRSQSPILTADRAWAKLGDKWAVDIQVIR